ncbi:hypothetical protein ACTFIR_012327 [Dictyostelium discoideum]
MGNYFFKSQIEEEMLSDIEINSEKANDVYVLVYADRSDQPIGHVDDQSSGTAKDKSGNAGHFAIGVDLTGQSKEGNYPALWEVHLVLVDPKNSKRTTLLVQQKVLKSQKLIRIVKVGNAAEKFRPICGGTTDTLSKIDKLNNYFTNMFIEKFINQECKGDHSWGRDNNCHNFTKFCIKDLGLVWPESIVSPLDNYPFLSTIWSMYQDTNISLNQTA